MNRIFRFIRGSLHRRDAPVPGRSNVRAQTALDNCDPASAVSPCCARGRAHPAVCHPLHLAPGRKFLRRFAAAILLLVLLLLTAWLSLPLVPLPPSLFSAQIPQLEFADRDGHTLRAVRPGDSPFHESVTYAEIPQPLILATLAAEDQRFWRHHGVDWRASLRAAWQLVRHRHVVSGGSTITQQLLKLAAPRPRTCRTKVIEAVQALRLEQVWDKPRIISAYLNRLDYGNLNRGCATAACFYFAKPLSELTPAECALLAGLPQAPSRLNPHRHFEAARKRQQWVLSQMRRRDWLTEAEFLRARDEHLRLPAPHRAFEASHFVDLVVRQTPLAPGTDASVRPPLRTTLELGLNQCAERTLRQHLQHLRAHQVANGAVVVIHNPTAEVRALVGSEDYFAPGAGQVNGAWAPRSAGSTFKPFTYLLALEAGATPATVVADVPTEFATATGLFAPVNYNHRCYGPMRYRLALANSLNISAVRVLASLGGPEPLRQLLQSCGLSTLSRAADDYGLGLTIGNAETRLLELANAYACLARLGQYRPYRLLLSAPPIRPVQLAAPGAAYLIADMLSDNSARTLAFGAEGPLRFDFPVACKTGTSSDFRDNWAFAYTPEFTIGVWVGNFDGTPMQQVSGVTGAAPILHDLFEHLHQQYGTSWYPPPAGLVDCRVHPITGKRLADMSSLREAVPEKFLPGHLPPLESLDDYDSRGRVRLGPEYRDWLASGDNWLKNGTAVAQSATTLRIVFPLPGTTFYLDPDLPSQGRRLNLRAEGSAEIQWQSDSLVCMQEGAQSVALLTEGRHQLTVRDPLSGAQAQTWVQVLAR